MYLNRDKFQQLDREVVFLALTRPASKFGIPLGAFVLNLILSVWAWVVGMNFLGNPMLGVFCFVVLHSVFYTVFRIDPHFFSILVLKIRIFLLRRERGLFSKGTVSPR